MAGVEIRHENKRKQPTRSASMSVDNVRRADGTSNQPRGISEPDAYTD